MPARHYARSRRALTRQPVRPNGVWITETVLQEVIAAFSGLQTDHPRCLHAYPGPLEGKRREAKRRMSGSLSPVNFEQPIFPMGFPEGLMNPTWLPPLQPHERHREEPITPSSVFNKVLKWLEDPPQTEPFIRPPLEIEHDTSDSLAQDASPNAAVVAADLDAVHNATLPATDAVPEAEVTQSIIAIPTLEERVANFESQTQEQFYALFWERDHDKIREAVRELAGKAIILLQEISHLPRRRADVGTNHGTHFQRIVQILEPGGADLPFIPEGYLRPYAVSLYLNLLIEALPTLMTNVPSPAKKLLLKRLAKDVLVPRTAMSRSVARPKIRSDLTQDDTQFSENGPRDGVPSWMANISLLAKAIRSVDVYTKYRFFKALDADMLRQWRKESTVIDSRATSKLGWLLLNSYGVRSSDHSEFRQQWQEYTRFIGDDTDLCDSHLYLVALARLEAAKTLSWKDWYVLVSWRDTATRWHLLAEYLMHLGPEGRTYLHALGSFWKEMGEYDHVMQRVLEASAGFQNSYEGLAVASQDHHMALRLYTGQAAVYGHTHKWHWKTWAELSERLLLDPSCDFETVKELVGFVGTDVYEDTPEAVARDAAEKVTAIEKMAEIVVHKVSHVGNVRKWTFLQELCDVSNVLLPRGQFSKSIISLMVFVMAERVRAGEVLTLGSIQWLYGRLRSTHDENTASLFLQTMEKERDRIRTRNSQRQQTSRVRASFPETTKTRITSASPRSRVKDLAARAHAVGHHAMVESPAHVRDENRFSDGYRTVPPPHEYEANEESAYERQRRFMANRARSVVRPSHGTDQDIGALG